MADALGGVDGFPWAFNQFARLLQRAVDSTSSANSLLAAALDASLGGAAAAKNAELYHIRAVRSGTSEDGKEMEFTLFAPEFLYVFDVGYPARVGLLCRWQAQAPGTGDPNFPDFTHAVQRSVYGGEPRHLIYPAVTGDLIVGTKPGTPEQQVRDKLKRFSENIRKSADDLYLLKVKPFHEQEVAATMESQIDFVRYAELNHIVRLNDFSPGWRCSRVL